VCLVLRRKSRNKVIVAKDVADLHSAGNNLGKETALSEKGEIINGAGCSQADLKSTGGDGLLYCFAAN
jgi:hypothetical protein